MKRREFLVTTAAATAFPLWRRPRRSRGGGDATTVLIRPFDLAHVRLRPGPFLDALEVNRRFLLAQDPDRLLHMYRVTAGLPSSAQPLGGWEAPVNELRGHYTGHYLSACALMAASLGDQELRDRGAQL